MGSFVIQCYIINSNNNRILLFRQKTSLQTYTVIKAGCTIVVPAHCKGLYGESLFSIHLFIIVCEEFFYALGVKSINATDEIDRNSIITLKKVRQILLLHLNTHIKAHPCIAHHIPKNKHLQIP